MKFINQTKSNNCLATTYYNIAEWLGTRENKTTEEITTTLKYIRFGYCDNNLNGLKTIIKDKAKILSSAFNLSYLEVGDFLKNSNNFLIARIPITNKIFHTFAVFGSDDMQFLCPNAFQVNKENGEHYNLDFFLFEKLLKTKIINDLIEATDYILLTKDLEKKSLDDFLNEKSPLISDADKEENLRSHLIFFSDENLVGYTGSDSSYPIKNYPFLNERGVFKLE